MSKEGKVVYLNVIDPKKRIAELIADCPTLLKKWSKGEIYMVREREAIVKAYNGCSD